MIGALRRIPGPRRNALAAGTPNTSEAPAIDPIELAREAICALSFAPAGSVREIHTTKLSAVFERAGLANSMLDALGTLRLLREAERLDAGYWVPTPSRAVELHLTHYLLVAPHPTAELRRHFASVRQPGLGRVVEREDVLGLPKQSLSDWSGADDYDAVTWTRNELASALERMAPSLPGEGMEAFSTQTGREKRREPMWVKPGSGTPLCTWRGAALFRAQSSSGRHRYFAGRYQQGGAFMEGPAVQQPQRMQFGLAALDQKPLAVRVEQAQRQASISLPVNPPVTLRRLLEALCHPEPRSFGRVWSCQELTYLPVLTSALHELNCEISNE